MMICFLQLYCSFHVVCSVHMPQCVAFDYFSIDCEKQSVSKKLLKFWGRHVALGPQRKQGALHFKRVPGSQKVYFSHCLCVTELTASKQSRKLRALTQEIEYQDSTYQTHMDHCNEPASNSTDRIRQTNRLCDELDKKI